MTIVPPVREIIHNYLSLPVCEWETIYNYSLVKQFWFHKKQKKPSCNKNTMKKHITDCAVIFNVLEKSPTSWENTKCDNASIYVDSLAHL